jgi:hypothetical protein
LAVAARPTRISRPRNIFRFKTEEINGKAFADISDARRRINRFIAEVYNKDGCTRRSIC